MPDYLNEYIEMVTPIIPLWEEMCQKDMRRATLQHQMGLVNAAISIQQFIMFAHHIEKLEGVITIQRLAGILATIFHLQSDRMAFMSDMDTSILEAVTEGMYPMINRVIESMGVEWTNGE